MPSQQILEPPARPGERVSELLVLRQHPETREIVPIGRLTKDTSGYAFRYTRAAADAVGLRPLPGFERLDQRYTSETLPTIFAQRVMGRDRPDYVGYVHSLGLDPAHATPWEQIVESGGQREGDTLQFMEVPYVRDDIAYARFFVNGVRHIPDGEVRSILGQSVTVTRDEHEQAIRQLASSDCVNALPQDANQRDPHAMIVVSMANVPLGWVPQALSSSLRELAEGRPLPLTVVRIGSQDGPSHQRLVVEMETPVPLGFRFDREDRWLPIVGAGSQ